MLIHKSMTWGVPGLTLPCRVRLNQCPQRKRLIFTANGHDDQFRVDVTTSGVITMVTASKFLGLETAKHNLQLRDISDENDEP